MKSKTSALILFWAAPKASCCGEGGGVTCGLGDLKNSITVLFTTCSGYHLDLPCTCPISLTSPLSGLDGVSGF